MQTTKFKGKLIPLIFLAPTLLVLLVFLYYPVIQTFRLSTYRVAFLGLKKQFIGLDNFLDLAQDPGYMQTLRSTALITVAIVIGGMALSLAIAMLANRDIRGASIYRVLLIWPYALSPAVAGVIWLFMFSPGFGAVNYLTFLVTGSELNWLGNPRLAVLLIIMASIWKNLGYNIVFYIAALQNVNTEVLEAASIDGAGAWKRFWSVTFALISPMTFFLLITNIIYSFFNIFGMIDLVTKGGPLNSTNVMIYNLYRDGFEYYKTGLAAAQSVILFVAVIILTVIQFRTSGRRVHYGG
ncbi:MAG: sugar ABC transporter permease [Chloroflexi bacterium]|nr:MAG: glycerol-3-phosphate ABC transporter permease [Anaerolineaceae bacterium 4572_32.2]RLC78021.1 MAG: sugar ABC transporter permease [Chloroflexota bacterium]RLC83238.1 MAG: sugar ABC transporter permease [Chloroflexota bacterium]HEY73478.1 sugar ABC transporter permease [Thermoflexia bacterium]